VNRREKILAIVVGIFVGSLVIYMSVDRLIVSDVKKLNRREAQLIETIQTKQRQLNSYQARASRLGTFIDKTFGSDKNLARERVRVRLDRLLKATGMEISVKPVDGRKVQGQYQEIGWAVTAVGKIGQLVDFLYLLNGEPYLHRVTNLTLEPKLSSGQVVMKLWHMTIIPDSREGKEYPPGTIAESENPVNLDTPQRKQYDVIASRDPFRPYVKYVEPPETPEEPPKTPSPPSEPADPLKVVSLSAWGGPPEAHIRNLKTNETEILKLGGNLADGKIVMIDYRLMPHPEKPELLSTSRLILKQGDDYYAVELGQEVAKKHRLPASDLPEELRSK